MTPALGSGELREKLWHVNQCAIVARTYDRDLTRAAALQREAMKIKRKLDAMETENGNDPR